MKDLKNILFILEGKEKWNLFFQVALMFAGTLLEMLGIGILLPVIVLLSDKSSTANNSKFLEFFSDLGITQRSEIILYVMSLVVAIYFIKLIFLSFQSWNQNSFIYNLQYSLSQKLYTRYLNKSYLFHVEHNSAELIHNVRNVVQQFSASLMSVLTMVTEFLNLTGIVVLLFLIEPLGTLIILIFLALSGWLFSNFTNKKLAMWGRELNYFDSLRLQHLQQGLGGPKEVKIFGAEDFFISEFGKASWGITNTSKKYMTIQALPRLLFEFLAVIGILLLVKIMLVQGESLESVIAKIGIFTAAAFRLIPSLNKIVTSVQNVRYTSTPLDVLKKEFSDFREASIDDSRIKETTLSEIHTIELKVTRFKYPGAVKNSIENVCFHIARGQSIGIIGSTGAGKSTLIDIILGLLSPDEGYIKVNGQNIDVDVRLWQKQIGYVPQFIFLTDDSLLKNIAFGIPDEKIDLQAVTKAISLAQLSTLVAELPSGLETKVGERGIRLSGGQRQRLGIARALYHDPSILILDEATSALDIETEKNVMGAVEGLYGNKTVIIIAHRYSTVENCDVIYKLENGTVVQTGTPAELLETEDTN